VLGSVSETISLVNEEDFALSIYTDSQNIIGLQGRRDRIEKNDYRSKSNKRLNNYELYQQFYRMIDQMNFELVKVRGHQRSNQKNDIDRLFTLVDRASRSALRKENIAQPNLYL
jgi:ribonuclease HI